MSRKILITGGAGFIGMHLTEKLLQEDCQIDLVDNFKRGVDDQMFKMIQDHERINFFNIDLLNKDSVENLPKDYDVIFHLAAIIGVVHVLERPYEVLYDNIELLSNMIDLAKKQKNLSRFLFASTSEVYAGTLENFSLQIPTPENTPLSLTDIASPRSSYMLSKIYGEAMCHHSGLPYTIFRPHNLYGPRMGMAHLIPEQLQKAYNSEDGDSIDVYSTDHTRSFCYIDDATQMLLKIINEKNCEGKTLNIGSQGPELSIKDVVELCYEIVGKNLEIKSMPATQGSPSRRNPDMDMIKELINYDANIDLKTGIKKTYEWYKENVFDNSGLTAL